MNELASPGSVCPTLQQLEDEGRVRRRVRRGAHTWEGVADETEAAALEVRDLVMRVMAAARQVVHTGEA